MKKSRSSKTTLLLGSEELTWKDATSRDRDCICFDTTKRRVLNARGCSEMIEIRLSKDAVFFCESRQTSKTFRNVWARLACFRKGGRR